MAWESRSTEQLARDLTEGPGPMSVGAASAASVRVTDELATVSMEYDGIIEDVRGSFVGQAADGAARKLEDFGRWLQAVSLSAAGNGQQAEEAAVANGVAVLSMPSVSEAIETRATHEVMASLAAYNGAVLSGQFAVSAYRPAEQGSKDSSRCSGGMPTCWICRRYRHMSWVQRSPMRCH